MTLIVKHPDAERLARKLAARTGETLTDAVLNALRERRRDAWWTRSPARLDRVE